MISLAAERESAEEAPAPETTPLADVRPLPRISIQAFCESADLAAVMELAAADRRMARTHVKVQMGGLAAAGEFYRQAPTPNLIIASRASPANGSSPSSIISPKWSMPVPRSS